MKLVHWPLMGGLIHLVQFIFVKMASRYYGGAMGLWVMQHPQAHSFERPIICLKKLENYAPILIRLIDTFILSKVE